MEPPSAIERERRAFLWSGRGDPCSCHVSRVSRRAKPSPRRLPPPDRPPDRRSRPMTGRVLCRAYSTSSWAGGSRCCTPVCVRTARGSWRRSPSCTSFTSSRSAAGCTRTRSRVSGRGVQSPRWTLYIWLLSFSRRFLKMKGKDQEGLPNSISVSQLAGGGPVKSVHRLQAAENLPALLGPRAVTRRAPVQRAGCHHSGQLHATGHFGSWSGPHIRRKVETLSVRVLLKNVNPFGNSSGAVLLVFVCS